MLAERDHELEQIRTLLDAAANNNGRTLLVEAPAGMGKSALLAWAHESAEATGLGVIQARGTEAERDWAYGVVRQLFEPVVANADDATTSALFQGAAGLAADLVTGGAWPSDDPTAVDGSWSIPGSAPVFATRHGLYWLAVNLSGVHPLLIVVDDFHWCDAASATYLAHLSRRIDGLPIALLVATRPRNTEATPELIVDLAMDTSDEILSPSPLTVAAVADLVRTAMRQPCENEFAAACHSVTGGNPFLTSELIRSMKDRGVAPIDKSAGQVLAIGPERVGKQSLLRLSRLAPAASTLAEVVAVMGPSTELVSGAAVAGLSLEEANRAADALASAGILEDARPLIFVHPMVSTSIAYQLPIGQRNSIHAAAARHFATRPSGGERAAAHLLATGPVGEPWAVDILQQAARRALADGVPETAVAYLRRAAQEDLDDSLRGDLLANLGFAESHLAFPDAVGHLRQAMDLMDAVDRQVAVVMALGRILQLAGQPREAVEVYQLAAENVSAVDQAAELALRGALLAAAELHTDTADLVAAERSWLTGKVASEPSPPHSIFGPLAIASAFAGEPAAGTITLARTALSEGRLFPEALDRPPFFYHATTALLFVECFPEAEEMLDVTLADALSLGSIQHVVALSAARSLLYTRTGRLAEAESEARQVLELGAPPMFLAEAVAALVDVLVDRGELEMADAELVALGFDDDVGRTVFSGLVLLARSRLRLAQSRYEEALADATGAGELQRGLRADTPTAVPWRSQAAHALLTLGRPEQASSLAAEELALAKTVGTPLAIGRAQCAVGLAAQDDRRLLLEEAVSTLTESGAPLEHAKALLDFGSELRRSGQPSESREPLRQALDLAHRCGAWALTERAHTELQAAGARPRRIAISGVDSLTASERRIALMAADGRTNNEIAQALYITSRTVEGHLTHVYQKLGIASRKELPTALVDTSAGWRNLGTP